MGEFTEMDMPEPDFSADLPEIEPAADIVEESPRDIEPAADIMEEEPAEVEPAADIVEESPLDTEPAADIMEEEPAEIEPTADIVEETSSDTEPPAVIEEESPPDIEPSTDGAEEIATSDIQSSPELRSESISETEPESIPEMNPESSTDASSDRQAQADGEPSYSESEVEGTGYVGPEQTELHHGVEDTREIEPGVGPNPTWDQAPDGSSSNDFDGATVGEDGWAPSADKGANDPIPSENTEREKDNDTKQSENSASNTAAENTVDEPVVPDNTDLDNSSSRADEKASIVPDTGPPAVVETKTETDQSKFDQAKEMDVDAIRRVMTKTVEDANDIRNLDSQNARKNLYERSAIGTLTEQLCYETTGAKNLNEIIHDFPWADGTTGTELQQVKSHVNMKSEDALYRYSDDLSKALGAHKDTKIDQAVSQLWDLRSTENWKDICRDLPPEVASAGDKTALKTAMLEKMVLRVPSEDVSRIQDFVRNNAVSNPGKYGLENPSGEDIESLVNRIKPATSDLTNHQLRLMARDVFQQKMELAGYPRGVSYAKHLHAVH